MPNPMVIGLTGAFGSGCTTAAKALRDSRGFNLIKLSDPLHELWKQQHPGVEPKRHDLQKLGDELRKKRGGSILLKKAYVQYLKANPKPESDRWVVDGIRNLAEVEYLREKFGYRFWLLAVLASRDTRWERVSAAYTELSLGSADFALDDERDREADIRCDACSGREVSCRSTPIYLSASDTAGGKNPCIAKVI